ncbi:hypothetical protein FHG87_018490 [Trinorchestia longiramus]|nr:hypothetical protein FHG87_018490 [Trinorchestia longiramus]
MGVGVMQTKNAVLLEQSAYTKALLSRFGMDKENSVATPVDVNADLVTTSDEVEDFNKSYTCEYHQVNGHATVTCNQLSKLSIEEKNAFMRQHKLCYRCLGKHKRSDCTTSVTCNKCNGGHATALHRDSKLNPRAPP